MDLPIANVTNGEKEHASNFLGLQRSKILLDKENDKRIKERIESHSCTKIESDPEQFIGCRSPFDSFVM